MMDLTVIIPAYNVENYIVNCLDSLTKSQLIDIEIIVVNDGSTDNTAKLVQNYISENNCKAILINKSNEGQGIARNIGIELTTTKFLMFVDADDFVCENTLHLLLDKIKMGNIDLLCGNYKKIDMKGDVIKKTKIENLTRYSNTVMDPARFLSNHFGFLCYTWMFLYRTDFLKQLDVHFKSKVYLEDVDWLSRVIVKANSISMIDIPFYCYVQTPISSMRDVNKFEKRIHDTIAVTKWLRAYQKSNVLNTLINKWYDEMISINIIMLFSATNRFEYRFLRKVFINEMILLEFFPLTIKRMPLKFKLASFYINIFFIYFKLMKYFKIHIDEKLN